MKSIFRMDQDQGIRRIALQEFAIQDGYYEYETHIFFDDAFQLRYVQDSCFQRTAAVLLWNCACLFPFLSAENVIRERWRVYPLIQYSNACISVCTAFAHELTLKFKDDAGVLIFRKLCAELTCILPAIPKTTTHHKPSTPSSKTSSGWWTRQPCTFTKSI